ncbi:MAG: riboflavin synthase, partial [Bacteroidetes bacterium]|nr:riboflavin synthase [Bacteroidota bacterium]
SINLERAMSGLSRFDGHLVQGHVDTVGVVKSVLDKDGSWIFTFNFPEENKHLLVDKGSVCINGVSLTVINPTSTTFQVAIIPYTYENTSFKFLQEGDSVNLEFDILGKYIARYAAAYKI